MSTLAPHLSRFDSEPMLLAHPRRTFTPAVAPPEPWVPVYDPSAPEDVEIDDDGHAIRPGASPFRRAASRFVAGFAIGISALLLAQVVAKPEARHALLNWGTGGHGAAIQAAASRAGSMFSHGLDPFTR